MNRRTSPDNITKSILGKVNRSSVLIHESELKKSEEKYRELFNAIDEGFCLIKLIFDSNKQPINYQFLEVNKMFEKQTGLKNVVGKLVTDAIPNIEESWIIKYGAVAQTGKSMRFVSDSKAMGKWFDVNASRIGDPHDRTVALLFSDITERVLAERQKDAVNKQIVNVLDSMGDAFFVLDKDWRIVRVNKNQEKISQTKRKDTLGKNFWEVFPAAASTTSQFWIKYNVVMKSRKPQHFIERYEPLDLYTEVDVYPTQEGGISVFFRDITKSLKTTAELKHSEERFRTLIEKSTDAIQLVDTEGKIIYSSDSIKNVLGYSADELHGSGLAPFIHPDDLEMFGDKLAGLIKFPKKQIRLEYRVKHKDGSWAWVETTGVNHLKTPYINALVGTFRNVTDRKKVEEEAQYRNSILEAQQDVSPLGIIIISDKGNIASYNNRFAGMWRFSKELLSKDLDEILLKTAMKQLVEPDIFMNRVNELYKNKKMSNDKIVFKDGRIFDRYGSPLFGKDKKYYGYVWYFLDITKEKAAESALMTAKLEAEENEAELRFMAESMPQKVFTANAEGLVDYFNPQWMEYTGLNFDEMKDWGWLQSIHPDDVPENKRVWEHSISTGEPFELEHRLRGKNGEYHWHYSCARAMRDDTGVIIKWIGTNTDVESLKKTLSRKNQLEDLTVLLQKQHAELVALNEAKDEFTSLASHQLRTPATGVKQYLGMVLEGFTGDITLEQQNLLEQAYLSNEREISIIDDLLKIAQIDAGKVKLIKRRCDISALMLGVLNEQSSKFKVNNQDITFIYKGSVNAVIDQERMRMVLENLIDNAGKYTPAGKNIDIKIHKLKDKIKILIQDQGVGIKKSDVDKLFSKFQRLNNPLSVAVGGNGLGLYWAKKIIDLHNGTIEVESKINVGTVFTITIPA